MLAMLERKIYQSEVLVGFSENVCHFYFCSIHEYRDFKYFLEMADKWSCISHILERGEEEFQSAMRVVVSATPLYTTDLGKIECLMYVLMLILSPIRQKWKSQNS